MTVPTLSVDARTDVSLPRDSASAELALAVALAVVLAVVAPLVTVVVGLALFGIAHNFFELRYVLGRFRHVLAGRLLAVSVGIVTVIALARLTGASLPHRRIEIIAAVALISAALVWALRHRPAALGLGITVAATTGVAGWVRPDDWFVVLAHSHNVLPFLFLWDLSRTMPERSRQRFRGVQMVAFVAIPAVLLSGLGDPLLSAVAGGEAYTPVALRGSAEGARFFSSFAALQVLHYAIWCVIVPRHSRPDARSGRASVDCREAGHAGIERLLFGRPAIAVVGAAAAAFGVLFLVDLGLGRSLYSVVASYHAYLELPVVIAMVLGLAGPAVPTTTGAAA